MSTLVRIVGSAAESIRKRARIYKDVWSSRLLSVSAQIISARLAIGKSHEGEAGLVIARFVSETFRSVSIVQKIKKLSSSSIGKAFITKLLLDNVSAEKRSKILEYIEKISKFDGVDFIEGMNLLMKKHLSPIEYERINRILGYRLSNAVISREAIYDPVDSKLYAIDLTGSNVVERKIDLKNINDLIDLHLYGVLDKKKDFLSQYAEWKMLKFIEEGHLKGLKGKQLGEYVFFRIQQEGERDPLFFKSFHYYLAKHYDRLEKNKKVMAGFGEVMIYWAKLYKNIAASVTKAMAILPFLGPLADFYASLADSLSETGDKIHEAVKAIKSRKSIEPPNTFKVSILDNKRSYYTDLYRQY